jgi:glycosyltransferase involved in cell wall biosynthesis
MNILLITHEFPNVGGGVGRSVFSLANDYLQNGHKVILFTCKYSNYKIVGINGLKVISVKGFRRNELENYKLLTFISFIVLGFLKVKTKLNKSDIDIIHSFSTIPAGLLGFFLQGFYNKPHIVTVSGSDVPYHADIFLIRILRRLIKGIWRQSDKVIAVSQGILETALRTEDTLDKFKVIYNGVSSDFLINHLEFDETGAQYVKIILSSRLIKLKGVKDVIYALSNLVKASRISEFRLKIIGDGPELHNLKKIADSSDLSNYIEFTGYLKGECLIKEYLSADFFILTSYSESFGMVYLEALSCGLPVIGTNVGGIPEIIDETVGVLVEPGNIQQIEDAIVKMSKQYTTYPKHKLIAKAKEFSWETIADQYIQVYENAIGAK